MRFLLCLLIISCSGALRAYNLDRALEDATGVNVAVKQHTRSRVVTFPRPFGVFTNATVLASDDGTVIRIRCVHSYESNVDMGSVVVDAEAIVSALQKTFPVSSVDVLRNEKGIWWRRVRLSFPGTLASVYASGVDDRGKPVGYNSLKLEFLFPSKRILLPPVMSGDKLPQAPRLPHVEERKSTNDINHATCSNYADYAVTTAVVSYITMMPSNRVVAGIEFGRKAPHNWRRVRKDSPLSPFFDRYICDVTPISSKTFAARYFGRNCADRQEAVADARKAVEILRTDFGLSLVQYKTNAWRTVVSSGRRANEDAIAVSLSVNRILCLSIEDRAWQKVMNAEYFIGNLSDDKPDEFRASRSLPESLLLTSIRSPIPGAFQLIIREQNVLSRRDVALMKSDYRRYCKLICDVNSFCRRDWKEEENTCRESELGALIARFDAFKKVVDACAGLPESPAWTPPLKSDFEAEVTLGNLLGTSVPRLNSGWKVSFTNVCEFSRVDAFYSSSYRDSSHCLYRVNYVRAFPRGESLSVVRAAAEGYKRRVEQALGVSFVDSMAPSDLYNYKVCECSYRSLTETDRYQLSMGVRFQPDDGSSGRELTVSVCDKKIAQLEDQRKCATNMVTQLKLGDYVVGGHYDGPVPKADKIDGLPSSFCFTPKRAWHSMTNCMPTVDWIRTNLVNITFTRRLEATLSRNEAIDVFDKLCDELEDEFGTEMSYHDTRNVNRFWSESTIGDVKLSLDMRPAWNGKPTEFDLSLSAKSCKAYDRWYETRFLGRRRESFWLNEKIRNSGSTPTQAALPRHRTRADESGEFATLLPVSSFGAFTVGRPVETRTDVAWLSSPESSNAKHLWNVKNRAFEVMAFKRSDGKRAVTGISVCPKELFETRAEAEPYYRLLKDYIKCNWNAKMGALPREFQNASQNGAAYFHWVSKENPNVEVLVTLCRYKEFCAKPAEGEGDKWYVGLFLKDGYSYQKNEFNKRGSVE